MIDTGLSGRVALVIGATEGLGRVVARLFAAHGAWVAVCFRTDYQRAKSLVDEIRSDGGRALTVPGDARTSEGAWAAARYVEQEWAQIDVLLHAGGLAGPDEFAADPAPLISELVPGMRGRCWGRAVIFKRADSTVASDPYLHFGGKGLLINTLLVPEQPQTECIYEAARCALFFGSAWNSGITGTQLTPCNAEC
ncbi:MAG TPA: SDR family NAD(P)-dependent oxidoreductase [Chloroflexia bacterium]|nr:SDR family NAD(P)-dependent oxidoreductase [Chloroflexia bacterium]